MAERHVEAVHRAAIAMDQIDDRVAILKIPQWVGGGTRHHNLQALPNTLALLASTARTRLRRSAAESSAKAATSSSKPQLWTGPCGRRARPTSATASASAAMAG